jgi:tetratricopeptide (TPR) repeat protein
MAWTIVLASGAAMAQDERPSIPALNVSQPLSKNNHSPDDPTEPEFEDVRVKAIQQRIGILKEVMARKQSAVEAAAAAASRANPESATPINALESAHQSVSSSLKKDEGTENIETENGMHGNELLTPSNVLGSSPLEELEITTSPLNSLELANSLFITGRYSQALKGYQALLSSESTPLAPVDRDWLQCLTANCHRILGQIPQAERLYREVVTSKQNSYPVDHSKWYLDHLTRRKQLQAQMQVINAELEAVSRSPKN